MYSMERFTCRSECEKDFVMILQYTVTYQRNNDLTMMHGMMMCYLDFFVK